MIAETELFQNIKNMAINMHDVMMKVKNGEELSADERKQIIEYHVETVSFLSFCSNK
jgi:hypothetical protein